MCLGKYIYHDCYVTTAKLSIHGRACFAAKTMTNVAHPAIYSYTLEYVNIAQLQPAGGLLFGMKYKKARMQHSQKCRDVTVVRRAVLETNRERDCCFGYILK